MSDQLLFMQSNSSENTSEPFVNRQVVYVIDQNNGNYNGQIQLDTSSLSNSGKYASYSEAYLEVPFIILVQPTAGIANYTANTASFLNFAVGLKNGFYQLIHSLSVEYNNNSVIQLTPFTNFYINYKLMTSLSEGDVKKFGQSIGFYPDTADSFNYSAAAATNPDGSGLTNNRPFGYETLYPNTGGYIFSDNNSVLGGSSAAVTALAVGAAIRQTVAENTAFGQITSPNANTDIVNVAIGGTNYGVRIPANTVLYSGAIGAAGANLSTNVSVVLPLVTVVAGAPTGATVGQFVINPGFALPNVVAAAGAVGGGLGAAITGIGTLTQGTVAATAGQAVPSLYTTNLPSLYSNIPNGGGFVGSVANHGFYKRLQYIAFNPSYALYNNFTGGANYATTLLKNYISQSNAAPTLLTTYQILARIRLKDVHDFFDKLPLVKGAYLRFIINTNGSSQKIQLDPIAAAAGQPTAYGMYANSAPTLTNGTNPLLISSAQVGQGFYPVPIGSLGVLSYDGEYQISCGVVSAYDATNTKQSHSQTACRLYVPLYQLNPTFENQYISLNRTKKVVYRDIYQYSVNVGAGDNFNSLLTNGIPNPKTVVIIPILQSSANDIGGGGGAISVAPHQSPFSTEPGTTSPLIALTNLNIQIAGINQFLQNQVYDFEQFVNELAPQNALNGGLVDGLVSGLIGEHEYAMAFRYYVCDVSRRLPAEDMVPKSVQVLGKNQSNVAVTLFIFIEHEKSLTLDLITGAKID